MCYFAPDFVKPISIHPHIRQVCFGRLSIVFSRHTSKYQILPSEKHIEMEYIWWELISLCCRTLQLCCKNYRHANSGARSRVQAPSLAITLGFLTTSHSTREKRRTRARLFLWVYFYNKFVLCLYLELALFLGGVCTHPNVCGGCLFCCECKCSVCINHKDNCSVKICAVESHIVCSQSVESVLTRV